MSDKLAVILVSGDRNVLEMGLLYTQAAIARAWLPDIRVYLFGPSEVTVVTDPDLRALIQLIIEQGTVPVACKSCADKHHISDMLQELGCDVAYIGEPISTAIREGYVPMTW